MTKAFDKIAAGLEDALAYAKGDKSRGITHEIEVVDVGAIRKQLGLSQDKFAGLFKINTATLRNWEQHRREPDGPAKVLLYIISKEPEAVLRALQAV